MKSNYGKRKYAKQSAVTAAKKGKKVRKMMVRKGPKLDLVVTRNFRFIGKTAQTSSVHDCLLSNAKNTFVQVLSTKRSFPLIILQ